MFLILGFVLFGFGMYCLFGLGMDAEAITGTVLLGSMGSALLVWVLFYHDIYYFYSDGIRVFAYIGYEKKEHAILFRDVQSWAEFSYETKSGMEYTLKLFSGTRIFKLRSQQMGDADYAKVKASLPASIPENKKMEIQHEIRQAKTGLWTCAIIIFIALICLPLANDDKGYGAIAVIVVVIGFRLAGYIMNLKQKNTELKKLDMV